MYRPVMGPIEWAKVAPKGPWTKPRRLRGAKAAGIAYQRDVERELWGLKARGQALVGQWLQYCDARGTHWCQPDFIIRGRQATLVLEAKLSWVIEGHGQLEHLYIPVVEAAFGLPAMGAVVCKILRPLPQGVHVVRDLDAAVASVRAGRTTVLHWLGHGKQELRRAA